MSPARACAGRPLAGCAPAAGVAPVTGSCACTMPAHELVCAFQRPISLPAWSVSVQINVLLFPCTDLCHLHWTLPACHCICHDRVNMGLCSRAPVAASLQCPGTEHTPCTASNPVYHISVAAGSGAHCHRRSRHAGRGRSLCWRACLHLQQQPGRLLLRTCANAVPSSGQNSAGALGR